MLTIPEQPEPIDWSHYRKHITTPGLVDNFQKQFESLTVPYPEDVDTPLIEKHRKEFVSSCFSVDAIYDYYIIIII